jgi:hypothetical protein
MSLIIIAKINELADAANVLMELRGLEEMNRAKIITLQVKEE